VFEIVEEFCNNSVGNLMFIHPFAFAVGPQNLSEKKPLSRVAMGIFSVDNGKLKVGWLFIQF